MTDEQLQEARDRMAKAMGLEWCKGAAGADYWYDPVSATRVFVCQWLPDKSLDQMMRVVEKLDLYPTIYRSHFHEGSWYASTSSADGVTLSPTDHEALTPALAAFEAVLAWMDSNHEKENLQPASE